MQINDLLYLNSSSCIIYVAILTNLEECGNQPWKKEKWNTSLIRKSIPSVLKFWNFSFGFWHVLQNHTKFYPRWFNPIIHNQGYFMAWLWLKFPGNLHPLPSTNCHFSYVISSPVAWSKDFLTLPESDVASSAWVSIKRDEREENLSWRAWKARADWFCCSGSN